MKLVLEIAVEIMKLFHELFLDTPTRIKITTNHQIMQARKLLSRTLSKQALLLIRNKFKAK